MRALGHADSGISTRHSCLSHVFLQVKYAEQLSPLQVAEVLIPVAWFHLAFTTAFVPTKSTSVLPPKAKKSAEELVDPDIR